MSLCDMTDTERAGVGPTVREEEREKKESESIENDDGQGKTLLVNRRVKVCCNDQTRVATVKDRVSNRFDASVLAGLHTLAAGMQQRSG